MKWNNSYNIDPIIAKINEVRKLGENGSVSFSDHDHEGWTSTITSMIELPASIPLSDKRGFVGSALLSRDLPSQFSKTEFEIMVDKEKKKYWRKPQNTYFVVFEFPWFVSLERKQMKLNTTTLFFSRSRKTPFFKNLVSHRTQLQKDCADILNYKPTTISGTQFVIAKTLARNAIAAQETCTEDFQVLLGLINMFNNRSKRSRWGTSLPRRPINDFVYLPFVTVHDASGELAHQGYWYQDWSPSRPLPHAKLEKATQVIARHLPTYLSEIKKLPWNKSANRVLARYYQAFSEPDLEVSFLDAWRTLEKFGGKKMCSYDDLIQRCSNMFEERQLTREIGRHLTERRNSITHGNLYDGSDKETVAYQLMVLMHPLLNFYLRNPFKSKSLEDLWIFADLEMDEERLQHQIDIRKHALTFIS